MDFSIIVIGDEILSGRRKDKHLEQTITLLAARGLELVRAEIIGDVEKRIVETLRRSMATDGVWFCFGGIGATPDDLTRACAATAAGVRLQRHPEAVREIEAQFGADAYPNRILMADIPDGCRIIPNYYNRVPGFSLGHHHFFPGFPEMALPMLEYVLENQYQHLFYKTHFVEKKLRAYEAHESELLDLMNGIVNDFPQLRFSSLPHIGVDAFVEFGFKGEQKDVEGAYERFCQHLNENRIRYVCIEVKNI